VGYIYGKPCRRRDGKWWYWGKHQPGCATPEIVESFDSADEARAHAKRHGYGKPAQRDLRKQATKR
jgi:hypothetical protein